MTANTIVLLDGNLRTEALLFEARNDIVTYSVDGGPLVEVRYKRRDGNTFIIREQGLVEGAFIKCAYNEAQIREKFSDPLVECLFTNPENPEEESQLLKNIDKRIFRFIACRPFPIYKDEAGTIEREYQIALLTCSDFPDANVALPIDWVVLPTPEEESDLKLREDIREILNERESKRDANTKALLEKVSQLSASMKTAMEQIRASSKEKNEDYVYRELSAKDEFLHQIYKDERVLSVRDLGENGLEITTNFLWNQVQETSVRFALGPVLIKLDPTLDRPILKYLLPNRLNGHPHELSGGRVCTGRYGGKYNQAIVKRDFFTAFNIAIEILENTNLNDTANRVYNVLRDFGVTDDWALEANVANYIEYGESILMASFEDWKKGKTFTKNFPKNPASKAKITEILSTF